MKYNFFRTHRVVLSGIGVIILSSGFVNAMESDELGPDTKSSQSCSQTLQSETSACSCLEHATVSYESTTSFKEIIENAIPQLYQLITTPEEAKNHLLAKRYMSRNALKNSGGTEIDACFVPPAL